MIDLLIDLDSKLFVLINQTLSASWLDGFMVLMSNPNIWIPIYMLFLFLIIRKFKVKAWLPILFLILCFAASDSISSRVFKPVFKRTRPCNIAELHARTPAGISKSYGFVSSHAANHFALAIFMILLFKPKKFWLFSLLLWAAIIAYSRVYLGKHFPLDVLVGAMLGTMIALLLYVVMGKLEFRFFSARKR